MAASSSKGRAALTAMKPRLQSPSMPPVAEAPHQNSQRLFKGGNHRVYVDSAPAFRGQRGLTVAAWHRFGRLAPHARDQSLPARWRRSSVVASEVFDLRLARTFRRGVEELNLASQSHQPRLLRTRNYFESRG
jgi:hypothetical protein